MLLYESCISQELVKGHQVRQKLILSFMVVILTIIILGPAVSVATAVPYSYPPEYCAPRNGEGGLYDAFAWFWDEVRGAGSQCNVGYGH